MLEFFYVNNFRSLLNTKFCPVGANLLMGPNNAGKTNLLSAIRLLGLTSAYPLETAIRNAVGETWNITNVYESENTMTLGVRCSLPYENE